MAQNVDIKLALYPKRALLFHTPICYHFLQLKKSLPFIPIIFLISLFKTIMETRYHSRRAVDQRKGRVFGMATAFKWTASQARCSCHSLREESGALEAAVENSGEIWCGVDFAGCKESFIVQVKVTQTAI